MQDRGLVQPGITSISEARVSPTTLNDRVDLAFHYTAERMRTGRNQQRGITRRHGIDVYTHRDHPLDQINWRFDMRRPVLRGPILEAREENTPSHRDRSILMPPQRPVGFARLVEEDRSNWIGPGSKDRPRYLADRSLGAKAEG